MSDFNFTASADFSPLISGGKSADTELLSLSNHIASVGTELTSLGGKGASSLKELGSHANAAGKAINDGIGHGLDGVKTKLDATKKHGESFFSSFGEKAGDIGKLLGGGILVAGLAGGLEGIFSAGEKRIKSLEDYKIALRQSGVAEEDLGSALKKGGAIVEELSNKYAKSGSEIRSVLTAVSGIGGISVDQSKKVAEIGLAFEQVGIPAKAFKAILQGAGGAESAAALDSIKTKFPALAGAIDGAGTAGQKLDAIYKGLTPTLLGMKEAADGPLGAIEKIKNTGGAILGKLGESLITILEPLSRVLLPIIEVIGGEISTLTKGIGEAFAPLSELFSSAGGGANTFKDILNLVLKQSMLPIELSIKGISLAIKLLVEGFNSVGSVVSDIGNFLGLTSDIDNANTHASQSVREAKKSFEEYGKAITDVDTKISETGGAQKQADELEKLSAKTNLTADESSRLAKLQSELNTKFPEATSGVNALTGAFEINSKKAKELAAEQSKVASDEKKKLIQDNLIQPTKDLLPALDAQKAKLVELRAQLDAAVSSGDKEKILEAREAYLKQNDAVKGSTTALEENLKALVQQGVLGKGSTEEIAKGMGISTAEAAKLVPVVAEINKGLAEQAEQAKKTAESIGGLAKEFDGAKKAADGLKAQSISALAELKDKQRQIRDQQKAGEIDATEAQKQLNALTEDYNRIKGEGLVNVKSAKVLEQELKDSAKELGAVEEKKTKTSVDLVGLAIAQQKVIFDTQKLELLRADNGKLSLKHQIDLLNTEQAGQVVIEEALKKETAKLEKLKDTVENQKKLADAKAKELESEIKIEETAQKIREEQEKLQKAIDKINTDVATTSVSFLKMLDTSKQLTGGTVGLEALQAEARIASDQFKALRNEFATKPDAAPLLAVVDQFVDATGKLKKGVDPIAFQDAFRQITDQLKDVFAAKGIDPSVLEKSIITVGTAANNTTKGILDQSKKLYESYNKTLSLDNEARAFLISESGLSEVDQVRLKIDAEKFLYDEQLKAAGDNAELRTKIEEDHLKNVQKLEIDNYKARKKQAEDFAKQATQPLAAGFNAAFQVANKGFFDAIDKKFDVSKNVAGAFTAAVIKGLVQMGEQAVENLILTAAQSLITGAIVGGSMSVIASAAAPAAAAVSIASFGAADIAALSGMTAVSSLSKLLFHDIGGRVTQPTLSMLALNSQPELVLPEKSFDKIMNEKLNDGTIGGGGGLSKQGMKEAFSEALVENPPVPTVTGNQVHQVFKRQANANAIRR